jgi:hypothetical protein
MYEYLLDQNFYASVPSYVYISAGFFALSTINSCLLCCYYCKIKKIKKDIELKEIEIKRRENNIERRQFIPQTCINDDGVHLSVPMNYYSQ